MSLSVAIQMDPIAGIDIDADTTFRMAESAQERGHRLFYYNPESLIWDEGTIAAVGWPLEGRRRRGDHFALGDRRRVALEEMDVILLRQDPPFDMAYVTSTHFLERVHPKALVVNDPFWVRNCPEKILVLDFPDLSPTSSVKVRASSRSAR